MCQTINGGVCAAQGFRAAGLHVGVKTHATWKKDVALIVSDVPCTAAAMFTRNVVKAAPIHVTRDHLAKGSIRAVIANSGNANACAPQGEENAENEKKLVAEKKDKLDESIRKETKRLIEDSVEEANELLDQIKALLEKQELKEADLFEARNLRKKLETMSTNYEVSAVIEDAPDDSPLNIGDNVWVKTLKKRGKLVSVNSRGEAQIAIGKITVKVKSGDYYKVK